MNVRTILIMAGVSAFTIMLLSCFRSDDRRIERLLEEYDQKETQTIRKPKSEWVDLGLPSGTLWKCKNEPGKYTDDEAAERFDLYDDCKLPRKKQCLELKYQCEWDWLDSGYRVTGPNGNSMFLPVDTSTYYSNMYGYGEMRMRSTYYLTSEYEIGLFGDKIYYSLQFDREWKDSIGVTTFISDSCLIRLVRRK